MSRTTQKKNPPSPKSLSAAYARDIAQHADWLAVLAIARQFVPFIVGAGMIPSYGNGIDAPSQVADLVARQGKLTYNLDDLDREELQLLERLGGHAEADAVGNLFMQYLTAGTEAGYVVGVAVGQALGRDALNGGGAR
jgi:hypothetical protein